jgi:hypothetical protein
MRFGRQPPSAARSSMYATSSLFGPGW